MRFLSFISVLLVSTILLVAGCQERDAPVPAVDGTVTATPAYEEHFGPPPQGKAGRAYARVGYLPLHDQPDQVRAVPLFVFDPQNELQKILERLTGDALVLPEDKDLIRPFPDDLGVTIGEIQDGVQLIALTSQQSWPASERTSAAVAMAETALQFARIEKVRLTLNGAPLPGMPAEGYGHDPQRIAPVLPPALVLMGVALGHDADQIKELLVEFDRPVEVNSFQLFDDSGDEVKGEYYTSIFQMAIVVRPAEPERFAEGTLLRAEWEVSDYLGRQKRGSTRMALRSYHP